MAVRSLQVMWVFLFGNALCTWFCIASLQDLMRYYLKVFIQSKRVLIIDLRTHLNKYHFISEYGCFLSAYVGVIRYEADRKMFTWVRICWCVCLGVIFPSFWLFANRYPEQHVQVLYFVKINEPGLIDGLGGCVSVTDFWCSNLNKRPDF